MNSDSRSNAGSFVAGAVIGGAVGGILALLFAPQSGEETRKMIAKKAKEAGEDFEEFKDKLEPKIEKAKKDIQKKFKK